MKFEPKEIAEVVFNKNWELKIHPICKEWYIEVVDVDKCKSFLEKALLRESTDVWMGNKGIFFSWDGDFLLNVIAELYRLQPTNYSQYLIFE